MKKSAIGVISLSLFLGGCLAQGSYSPQATTVKPQQNTVIIFKCPSLVKYDIDDQKAAAAEMKALPDTSVIARMIIDYGKLRDACRISRRN